jgi:putative solute:sodium symporter small subunit
MSGIRGSCLNLPDGLLAVSPSDQSHKGERGENMKKDLAVYWKKNLFIMSILLIIWAVVSYGCGILFVEPLNAIRMGGFPLGFWFAQQGSIYVFLVLIFVYVFYMRKLDEEFDVHE